MNKRLFLLVCCLFLALFYAPAALAASYQTTVHQKPVTASYTWKLSYKKAVLAKSITAKSIYLTEYKKKKKIPLKVTLTKDRKVILAKPKKALKASGKYVLVIQNLKTTGHKLLANPAKIIFTVEPVKKEKSAKAVSESVVRTSSRTFKASITAVKDLLTITYDFRACRDNELITATSLTADRNYTLTFTGIPDAVSFFLPKGSTQELKKGVNRLKLAEKMKEYKMDIGSIRLAGNFFLSGVLIDSTGKKLPVKLVYKMK